MGLFSSKSKVNAPPKLTCCPNDAESYKCILLASYRGLPVEIIWEDTSAHEDKLSASLHMSNLHRFPCIDDGEFTNCGSAAVLTYLNIRGGAPSVHPRKARVLAMQQYWVQVLKTKVEPFLNDIAKNSNVIAKALELLNENLEGKRHIVGEFSLADIHWGAVLLMLEKDHTKILSSYKNINQWLAGLKVEIPDYNNSLKEVAA